MTTQADNKWTALRLSAVIAFTGGIITPALETVRRWHQMADPHDFIAWFDDYLIGGFLIFGAWQAWKYRVGGQRYLTAAWGFATGLCFCSFFGQLQSLDKPDPAPVSPLVVVWVKGVMFLVCITSLVLALKKTAHSK